MIYSRRDLFVVFITSFSIFHLFVADVSAQETNPKQQLIHDGQKVKFELPDSSIYEGPIKSGLFEGTGTLTWRDGDVYEGEFHAGRMNGKGILKTKTGDVYKGEFSDGLPHGYGEWSYSFGDTYKGEHVDGVFQGKGVYVTSHGDKYDAEFLAGKPNGKGKVVLENGDHYEGEIKNWRMHGEGQLERPGVETYIGSFNDGYYHGKGTLTIPNGSKYVGEFKKGNFDGVGEFTDKSGVSYRGQFQKSKQEGVGEIIYPNGAHYKGSIKNWRPDGNGEYVLKEGSKYLGEFVNGVYEGKGEFTYENGDRYIGMFEMGRYHGKGKYIYKNPNGRKQSYEGIWEKGRVVSIDGEEVKKTNAKKDKYYVEESLYKQSAMLETTLKAISKGKPNIPELYFLSFGGYGEQDVFMKEALFSEELFKKTFGIEDRAISLINNRKTDDKTPMATVGNLRRALNTIGERMNTEEDILFLYVTSHGSKKYGLAVNLGGVYLHDLKAPELAEMLKASGIKWKVLVVSACYSGTFLESLKDDYTMVMTSSKSDHVSFGCSDEAEFTFFGRAYFEKSLASTKSFKNAFEEAKKLIKVWEEKEGYSHSEPQFSSSDAIEDKLSQWRNSINARQLSARELRDEKVVHLTR